MGSKVAIEFTEGELRQLLSLAGNSIEDWYGFTGWGQCGQECGPGWAAKAKAAERAMEKLRDGLRKLRQD
jgi:hypothetical protein